MKAFLECIPCILRQAIQILKSNVKSPRKREQIIKAMLRCLEKIDVFKLTPPEATKFAHDEMKKLVGKEDLYAKEKDESNKEALSLYPRLKRMVQKAKDPLNMALRLSIAGNIIDYGAHSEFCVHSAIESVIDRKFAIDNYQEFTRRLRKAKQILYVGDNAGEIVFDKLLVQELKKYAEVVFAVKSKPALNDVLMKDAKFVGMDKLCKVIKSGSDNAGTILSQTTKEFKKVYNAADFVIAKGQGNLETLIDNKKPIFYLLMMKCVFLGEIYGVKKGDIILSYGIKKKT
ncbi:MAG: DUF89 family protein [Candidatus Margulisbacteria bacterium]|nr:DUF89 family protein [Candidatus Margulisiibacteriota bacterium]MBU1021833.1 DUF89 family protein [Candidatus Margulisiibacteriota bacterium]MBU1728992.1 DUF89 family protein [Candidatus Margulisiibacteriota bacterium]MBU1954455.1 DUF89 family protein [Candidatus Margulisiibacteriota bacterium]